MVSGVLTRVAWDVWIDYHFMVLSSNTYFEFSEIQSSSFASQCGLHRFVLFLVFLYVLCFFVFCRCLRTRQLIFGFISGYGCYSQNWFGFRWDVGSVQNVTVSIPQAGCVCYPVCLTSIKFIFCAAHLYAMYPGWWSFRQHTAAIWSIACKCHGLSNVHPTARWRTRGFWLTYVSMYLRVRHFRSSWLSALPWAFNMISNISYLFWDAFVRFRFETEALSDNVGAFGGTPMTHSHHTSSYLQQQHDSHHSHHRAYSGISVSSGGSVINVSHAAAARSLPMPHGVYNPGIAAHTASDWKTVFQHDNERILCVESAYLLPWHYPTRILQFVSFVSFPLYAETLPIS